MEPLVIARAPGHITLGSIYAPFGTLAEAGEQLTLTAAVNYYAYAIITPSRAADVHISVAGNDSPGADELYGGAGWLGGSDLPRAIAELFGAGRGLSIFLTSQAPLGVGLGLSGSLTVSMIKALAFSCGLDLDAKEVAALACYVRVDLLSLEGRDQCQYAAAYGGLNRIVTLNSSVRVDPFDLPIELQQSLEQHLMLFAANGIPHASSQHSAPARTPVEQASSPTPTVPAGINRSVRTSLEIGDWTRLGALLESTWLEQCRLAHVSQDDILVAALKAARECGALGGQGTRINSGFLVVICPQEHQPGVTRALAKQGLRRMPLALEPEGVQLLEAMPRPRLSSLPSEQDKHSIRSHLSGLR